MEDGFHATVECMKAKALQEAIREVWRLPQENKFVKSGTDWLMLLLDGSNEEEKTHTLYTLWRAWHLRNEMIQGNEFSSIVVSVNFLMNYEECTLPARQQADDVKDKGPMFVVSSAPQQLNDQQDIKWQFPPEGVAKMNVDAGFRQDTGEASVGIIIRDCRGLVLFAACKRLPRCNFATQAEAMACLEGVRMATEWVHMPIILDQTMVTLYLI